MSETITRLLSSIENKELVLPEFQREFQWNRDQSKILLDSLMQGYPTGSLLLWKTNDPPALKNMPDFETDTRVNVLLDGQQRLTVLYLLINDTIPPYYDHISNDPRDLSYNLKTGELRYYKKNEMRGDPRWVKVTDCFSSNREPDVKEITRGLFDGDEWVDKYDTWDDNLDALQDIIKEPYPLMHINVDANLNQALTVFDRVNSQGTPLSESAIALAHMVSSWPATRRELKTKLAELKTENFDFDLTFLVRCINAVINYRAEFQYLHDVDEQTLKHGWRDTSRILDYVINILRDRAHIHSTDDLNTTNALIPIINYLARNGGEFTDERERDKMLYWMYGALINRRYSGSVDANLGMDLNSLQQADPLEALINTLKEEEGSPLVSPSNLDMRGVRHPLYNMMVVIIRNRNGIDWKNGIDLSNPYGPSYQLERHHIFPKSQLKAAGYDTGRNHRHKKIVNEIANRVPITKSGNLEILKEKPENYLPEVVSNYLNTLDSHMIPQDPDYWKMENYEAFLERCRELIAEGINEYMQSLIRSSGKSSNRANVESETERLVVELVDKVDGYRSDQLKQGLAVTAWDLYDYLDRQQEAEKHELNTIVNSAMARQEPWVAEELESRDVPDGFASSAASHEIDLISLDDPNIDFEFIMYPGDAIFEECVEAYWQILCGDRGIQGQLEAIDSDVNRKREIALYTIASLAGDVSWAPFIAIFSVMVANKSLTQICSN